MNKSELIDAIAKEADTTKTVACNVLDAVTAAIVKAVSKGDSVSLIGFGAFKPSKRAARTGRNPQTGAAITIAAGKAPKFKVGKQLKDAVNKI